MSGDGLAQGLAGVASGGDGGLGFWAIHYFPSLADGLGAGEFATKRGFEGATAPDAFLVKRFKAKDFVHKKREVKIQVTARTGVIAFDRKGEWFEM